MWDGVLQGIFSGLASGWIYILVALGLALVFSILGILQFAHGELYMLGAYVVYYASVVAHIPFLLALLIAALTMGIAGMILERVMFRRIRGEMEPAILAAIGLTLLFQTVAVIAFGGYTKFIPSVFPGVIRLRGCQALQRQIICGSRRCCTYLCVSPRNSENQDREGDARSVPRSRGGNATRYQCQSHFFPQHGHRERSSSGAEGSWVRFFSWPRTWAHSQSRKG